MMRAPSKRSYRRKVDLEEPDLIPVMGLFVGLIPFLLTVVVFTKVVLISVPLPKVATSEEEIRKVIKEKFYLKVFVIDKKTKNQIRKTPGYLIDSNALVRGPRFFPLTDDKYDVKSLNEVVLFIKKKNEKEKSVVITLGQYVSYEALVTTLDGTREVLPELSDGDPSLEGIELFPNVILDKAG